MSGVVETARSWIGTPYVHQAARRGAGCDCLGLVRGVWAQVTGTPLLIVRTYTTDWSEPQGDETMWRGAAKLLVHKATNDVAAGDVLLFRMRSGAVAKHVGIQADVGQSPSFIHAFQGHGVLESALSSPWQRRIAARFAFPEDAQHKV